MFGSARTKTIAFWFFALVLFIQLSGLYADPTEEKTQDEIDQEIQAELRKELEEKKKAEEAIPQDLGNGINDERDKMDLCINAAGPRPINEVFSPGRTTYATRDDVNGGYCGVSIDSPGIWWWVQGTGKPITVSSCHKSTQIKVKFSVFTGSCAALECVSGSDLPDFACPLLRQNNENGEWNTIATAHTFETELDKRYFILVQGVGGSRGDVWINFRHPDVPQNDACVDAIGPVPRDLTMIENTNVDAALSIEYNYCEANVPAIYPGTWFQIMGTGDPVTIMACGEYNFDGYGFSVYNGAYCDSKECITGEYELKVVDEAKCTFGSNQVLRPLTKYKFDTHDRDRYWIYVHTAQTRSDVPTADFRFFVDDGKNGDGSSTGAHTIGTIGIIGVTREDAEIGNGGSNTGSKNKGSSSANTVGLHGGLLALVTLLAAW
eukprot:CAMPEP_0197276112 /NCGR_PEP_ID=MMETSP1432-20130617/14794_1 /TAXON_ID=44447 /ORGANISM="Pseudo-nitzschia delicatissima, Strain UNC1205" /LENGTH=434 /DNA_ID=CAMNT_0042742101 /DNA_START=63 /DNA_END=1364 /DNA_ORIENTATION=-